MFKKDKDYKFSFTKYQAECKRTNIAVGPWGKRFDGARVLVSKDSTKGLIHVRTVDEVRVPGTNMVGKQNGAPEAYLVYVEHCTEL